MFKKSFNLEFLVVDDEPGMSFGSGSNCPQASQTCCDNSSVEKKLNEHEIFLHDASFRFFLQTRFFLV